MTRVNDLIIYDERHSQGAGTNTEEKLFLYGLVRMAKPKSILEIGVSRGHMTAWLALALAHNGNGGALTSLDNWSRAHGGEATSPLWAQKRLDDNRLGGRVNFVSSSSLDYLRAQPTESFDFVWVDGDHSYEGAKADIVEAMRVASKLVGVHDTNQQYSGPRKAAEQLANGQGFWVNGCRGMWIWNK